MKGGEKGDSKLIWLNDVEVFPLGHVSQSCKMALQALARSKLPIIHYGGGGAILDNRIVVCGGLQDRHVASTHAACHTYIPNISKWKPISSMATPRSFFGMVSMPEGVLAVGGDQPWTFFQYNKNPPSNEILSTISSQWKRTVPPPAWLNHYCLVTFKNSNGITTAMAIGGYNRNGVICS